MFHHDQGIKNDQIIKRVKMHYNKFSNVISGHNSDASLRPIVRAFDGDW